MQFMLTPGTGTCQAACNSSFDGMTPHSSLAGGSSSSALQLGRQCRWLGRCKGCSFSESSWACLPS